MHAEVAALGLGNVVRVCLELLAATVRRRRLPVEEVVWVVLGMALFRDRPIEDVVSKLDLALPGGGGTIARSSVSQARAPRAPVCPLPTPDPVTGIGSRIRSPGSDPGSGHRDHVRLLTERHWGYAGVTWPTPYKRGRVQLERNLQRAAQLALNA